MGKERKPLSSKKPPIPTEDHKIIEEWMANRIMPGIKPLIVEIDSLIHSSIPNLQYAIKWGSAYYGTKELGWILEVAAYAVSVNIVFLNGAAFDSESLLGDGDDMRYMKLKSIAEIDEYKIIDYINQAVQIDGWK